MHEYMTILHTLPSILSKQSYQYSIYVLKDLDMNLSYIILYHRYLSHC